MGLFAGGTKKNDDQIINALAAADEYIFFVRDKKFPFSCFFIPSIAFAYEKAAIMAGLQLQSIRATIEGDLSRAENFDSFSRDAEKIIEIDAEDTASISNLLRLSGSTTNNEIEEIMQNNIQLINKYRERAQNCDIKALMQDYFKNRAPEVLRLITQGVKQI